MATRRDSAGTWQEDSEQGDRKAEQFSIAPRLTWKSGMNNLTLSPMLFRGFDRGDNTFERIDLTVPANNVEAPG